MATSYPGGLDTTSLPSIGPTDSEADAGKEHDLMHTNVNDAVKAIQSVLGTDPAVDWSTVKDAALGGLGTDQYGPTEPGTTYPRGWSAMPVTSTAGWPGNGVIITEKWNNARVYQRWAIGWSDMANSEMRRQYHSTYGWSAWKSRIVRIPHTWAISGDIKVASGDTDYILPFYVPAPLGQIVRLVAGKWRINSGTSATVYFQRNGADLTSATVTTTAGDGNFNTALGDGDSLGLRVSAVSGTPKNMTVTLYLDYEF